MKSISNALKAHLAQTVTTIAMCWRVIRTDGVSYAFTSLDADLTIDGITYQSTAGFSRSAIANNATGKVDNLDVVGFFSQVGISEHDLNNGLFDYATIYVFLVNWANLSQGIVRLRRGSFGECIRLPLVGFQAELRGLVQALVQEVGQVFTPICRADLGDSRCKVPIKPAPWAARANYSAGDYVQAATQSSDALLVAIFQAQANGRAGETEPAWDTAVGNTTTDGGVSWTSMAPYRNLATVVAPINAHLFTSTPLSLPALPGSAMPSDQAVLAVWNNVSSGTHLTVSDGVHSTAWNPTQDLRGYGGDDPTMTAAYWVEYLLSKAAPAAGLRISYVHIGGQENAFLVTNHSGHLGHISKTGDTLGALVIQDFNASLLDGGTVTWISGDNAGRSMEMKTYDPASQTVTLWLGMPYVIQAGDRFLYYPGCNKRRDTCHTYFANMLNFRGEPDMPGLDAVLTYPGL